MSLVRTDSKVKDNIDIVANMSLQRKDSCAPQPKTIAIVDKGEMCPGHILALAVFKSAVKLIMQILNIPSNNYIR